ncbi:Hypothetical protein PBC10988_6680 [Planctomycetales bacterium 10988]|nr:Hypothetical protein PBC10988_6680 [Planctomycetales bacterium 10988]
MQLEFQGDEGDFLKIAAQESLKGAGLMNQIDPMDQVLGIGGYRRNVLFDLTEAALIDSAAIGWLLQKHRKFEEEGGCLVLHSPAPVVMQSLKMLQMHKIFNIHKDFEAAKDWLASKDSETE